MMPFGQLLRSKREAKGISLTEMAKKMGISASYLSDVELGRRDPWHLERTVAWVTHLGGSETDLQEVLEAMVRGKRSITLHIDQSNAQQVKCAVTLMCCWERLSDFQLGQLYEFLDKL